MTKFNSIEAARGSEKARKSVAIVEFTDGTFGLSTRISIPAVMMKKHRIKKIHPKANTPKANFHGPSAFAQTTEGQAEARWTREDVRNTHTRF